MRNSMESRNAFEEGALIAEQCAALRTENERLAAENLRLREQHLADVNELIRLRGLLGMREYLRQNG